MTGKQKKKIIKRQSNIRPILFSIKWKGTLLVFVLFMIGVFILFRFITDYENKLLEKRLEETMNVYLETFRKDVEVILIEKHDRASLNDILQSYRSIKNFVMAMFVDNTGKIIVHTDESSVNGRVLNVMLAEFKKAYETRAYYSAYEDNQKKIHWFNGYLPFYHPRLSQSEFKTMNGFIELYRKGFLFKNDMLPDEARNDFRFIKEFDDAALPLIMTMKAVLSPALMKLTIRDRLELLKWNKKLSGFQNGAQLVVNDSEFSSLISLMKKIGLSDKKAEEFLTTRKDKKKLFNNRIDYSDEMKNDLNFIRYIGDYISGYMDKENHFTPEFDKLVVKLTSIDFRLNNIPAVKKDQKIEDSIINKDYFASAIKQLYLDYKNIEKFRVGSYTFSADKIEKILSDFKNIYRIGTIRIVLDLNQVKLDQISTNNDVINITIMVIIRLFALTYFFVSFLIYPLRILSKGTDEIAKGNLDKKITVSARDEIGQLADKFNDMTASLKKAFNEIKDKARMEAELLNASEIQEAILPREFPKTDKFVFSTYYKPETESGGDYYDFIDIDSSHFGIVIADVTGHGVGAGIVMAMLRSHLRTYAQREKDASMVLKGINPIIKRDTLPNMFATMLYAVIDTETDTLYYSNAGHHPAIIYNPRYKSHKQLETGGMPIGMVDSSIFNPAVAQRETQFGKGEFFIAYTDGIIEAKSKNDEEYGEERFIAAIKNSSSADPDEMRDGIIQDLKKFVDGAAPSDDITLIIIKKI